LCLTLLDGATNDRSAADLQVVEEEGLLPVISPMSDGGSGPGDGGADLPVLHAGSADPGGAGVVLMNT
jgi:hypothetical protein